MRLILGILAAVTVAGCAPQPKNLTASTSRPPTQATSAPVTAENALAIAESAPLRPDLAAYIDKTEAAHHAQPSPESARTLAQLLTRWADTLLLQKPPRLAQSLGLYDRAAAALAPLTEVKDQETYYFTLYWAALALRSYSRDLSAIEAGHRRILETYDADIARLPKPFPSPQVSVIASVAQARLARIQFETGRTEAGRALLRDLPTHFPNADTLLTRQERVSSELMLIQSLIAGTRADWAEANRRLTELQQDLTLTPIDKDGYWDIITRRHRAALEYVQGNDQAGSAIYQALKTQYGSATPQIILDTLTNTLYSDIYYRMTRHITVPEALLADLDSAIESSGSRVLGSYFQTSAKLHILKGIFQEKQGADQILKAQKSYNQAGILAVTNNLTAQKSFDVLRHSANRLKSIALIYSANLEGPDTEKAALHQLQVAATEIELLPITQAPALELLSTLVRAAILGRQNPALAQRMIEAAVQKSGPPYTPLARAIDSAAQEMLDQAARGERLVFHPFPIPPE